MRVRNRIRADQLQRQAEGYIELGMAEHALAVLDQLGKKARLNAHVIYLQGEALRSLGRHREALAALRRAARIAPDNIHVWLAIAWCRKRTARIDLAVHAVERALEIDPNEALLHYNLACYLSLIGQKRRALLHLSEALALEPGYRDLTEDEPDFDPIRSDPGFLELTSTTV